MVLEALTNEPDQESAYHIIIYRIMEVDAIYHKFTLEAATASTPKTKRCNE